MGELTVPTYNEVIDANGACSCATADEFLVALSARNDLWKPDPASWIFRGQADNWPLKAKAHRTDHDPFIEYGLSCPADSDWSAQRDAQEGLLEDFQRFLDKAALPTPFANPPVSPRTGVRLSCADPVDPRSYPLMALAQHLGLPTPLLDWIRQARVAAYFAASATFETTCPPRKWLGDVMVVWAARADLIKPPEMNTPRALAGGGDFGEFATPHLTLTLLDDMPRSSNPNLHAQSGLFTWLRHNSGNETAIDDFIVEAVPRAKAPKPLPVMRRLTVPRSCAPRLLKLLSHEGVDGSTMFPGYEGVVRAMKERALWEK